MVTNNHTTHASESERAALLALHHIPGIGGFLVKQLVGYCGSATEVFNTRKGVLQKIPHIGSTLASAINKATSLEDAVTQLNKVVEKNSRIVFFNEPQFPQRLNHFNDAPSMLYVRGNVDLNAHKTVGIIGTRQATHYGKTMVKKIVERLAAHRPLIISGLAYGIDIQAHQQALQHSISTLGVMASGIDIVYPASHKETAEAMLNNGGLITENALGQSPEAYYFPVRNRIIAGLSDALIVVETATKGGAIITAEIANSYNKDVFAVPGAVGQPYSSGCNNLIKTNKAHLLTAVDDLEYIMGWSSGDTSAKSEATPINMDSFSAKEQKILLLLQANQGALTIDEMSRKSSIAPGELAALLLNLELKRVIQAKPGKKYQLENQAP